MGLFHRRWTDESDESDIFEKIFLSCTVAEWDNLINNNCYVNFCGTIMGSWCGCHENIDN